MSKFFTPIKVDVDTIAKLLPPGAYVESVRWNPVLKQVVVTWDHQPFDTGRDYPLEFSAKDLATKKLPKDVTAKRGTMVPIVAPTLVGARAGQTKAAAQSVLPVGKPQAE